MRHLVIASVFLVGMAVVPTASASQIVSTSTVTGLMLDVNTKGEALLTYRSNGRIVHVLAWGAKNAISPTPGGKQVRFRLDYSGGWGKYFRDDPTAQVSQTAAANYWKTGFAGSCGKYDGPALAWLVVACKAPDGSYWAVQGWQRQLPNYGVVPSPAQAATEVHLSHWTGDLPVLTIRTDWAWHQWEHLYGTFTYRGDPVYGFKSTAGGQPLDSFGRNLYVDTYDSVYGPKWQRENSFLTHKGTGVFCYSFNPHGSHPAGKGARYRATIMGPGVTPDVMWEGNSPGRYNKAADAKANVAIAALGDKLCRPN